MQHDPVANHETIQMLESALKLVLKRNTIAHNPTMVEAYEHSQTGKLVMQRAIFSKTSKEFIDDAELTELLAAVEEIVSRLYHMYGASRNEQTELPNR